MILAFFIAMNIQTQKSFTQTEANKALGYVRKITEDIVQKWNLILSLSDEERNKHLEALEFTEEPKLLLDTKLLIEDIKYHTKELSNVGCLVRDLGKGIILFPTQIQGKDGYFVWKHGEEKVEKVYEKVEKRVRSYV